MREGHDEPPTDVRSFLPRPGEPVDRYAERLRTLHRDLTLVLQAVERGLAAAAGEPAPTEQHVPAPDDHTRERHEHVASVAFHVPGGGPRVEVMPAPAGPLGRAGYEEDPRDRRQPPDEIPADGSIDHLDDPGEHAPRRFAARPSARGLQPPEEPREPAWVEAPAVPPPGPPEPWQPTFAVMGSSRHSARVEAEQPPWREPRQWVDSPRPGDGRPETPRVSRLAPVLVALMITGWLLVAALAIALLFDGA